MMYIVLVTGSTRGIGAQIALEFLKQGNYVILNGRRPLIECHESFAVFEPYQKMYEYVQMDITNEKQIERVISEQINIHKRIDVLVNNAGINADATMLKMNKTNWDNVIDTNLTGVYNMCKAVIPHMINMKYGRIVNVASVVALSGNYGQVNYAASKAGVLGLTKTLALEVVKYGITVNAVAPGFINTKMTQSIPTAVLDKVINRIPCGSLGEPSDVSNAVLFLAKKESGYIVGETLSVNGGYYLH